MTEPNCPFYGRHMFLAAPQVPHSAAFLLIGHDGNQCALVMDACSPCQLEANKQKIDWRACPRMRDVCRFTARNL